MYEPLGNPEPQVGDVAAVLLNLDPSYCRAAIGPLIAMIERVVAGEEQLRRADRGMIPDSARASARQIDRVAR
jgi:hypothetical protein